MCSDFAKVLTVPCRCVSMKLSSFFAITGVLSFGLSASAGINADGTACDQGTLTALRTRSKIALTQPLDLKGCKEATDENGKPIGSYSIVFSKGEFVCGGSLKEMAIENLQRNIDFVVPSSQVKNGFLQPFECHVEKTPDFDNFIAEGVLRFAEDEKCPTLEMNFARGNIDPINYVPGADRSMTIGSLRHNFGAKFAFSPVCALDQPAHPEKISTEKLAPVIYNANTDALFPTRIVAPIAK
jgi:hypothetical protein